MRYFFDDVVLPILVILGVLAFFLGSIFAIGSVWEFKSCANLQELTGRHTEWRLFGGCYVSHEGEMLPYDRWKLLDVRIKERH